MDLLKTLKIPDYLSLIGLFLSWISILLILKGVPNWAIIYIMIAFVFDLLDGYTARMLNQNSKFGRQLDSYVDVFIYLIFSSLLFYFYLAPNEALGVLVGFLILTFGGLRLVRYNIEGIQVEKEVFYYRGITVVHILFLTIICYSLKQLTTMWTDLYSVIILSAASPTMVSNYKSYKIKNYWIFAIVTLSVIITCLILQYAY